MVKQSRNWFQRWFTQAKPPNSRRPHRLGKRPFRPVLETLEDRLTPSVFNVISTVDDNAPVTMTAPGVFNAPSLRSAITAANATAGGNTINLTIAGTYKITIRGTAGETDNFAGEFSIFPTAPNGNLTIQNTSGGTAIVDGNNLNRVFDINASATNNPLTAFTVTMIGFTIQNGVAQPGDLAAGSGGGIRDQGNQSLMLTNMVVTNNSATADGGGVGMIDSANVNFSLTITNSTISNNHAGDAGGGIDTDGGLGTVTITGSVITGNTDLNQGAGVYIDAIGTTSESMNMTQTIVSNNSALNSGITASGGGISNAGNGTMTITNCTVSGNFSGGQGGGFSDENNLGTLIVRNSYFLNNSAIMNGGGIQEGGPSTTITNTEIKGNSTGASGGGVFANGVTLTITACTIANNTAAGNGGGIELEAFGAGPGASAVDNSTITGNSALNSAGGTKGGGIDVTNNGQMFFRDDTISANFADTGGGVFWAGLTGGVAVGNTIIATNTASTAGPDADNPSGLFADNGGNLIGISGTGSGNTGFTAGTTQRGTVGNPLLPQLGPLQNNGGPAVGAPGNTITLETEALLTTSPAVDRGLTGAPAKDERGFPRPDAGVNEQPDIGAYELQNGPHYIAVAGGTGGSNEIKVFNAVTTALVLDFYAFPASFTGGVRVAVADVNGDGIPDIIVGTGPDSSEIKVFSGANTSLLMDFFANFMFNPGFTGGVFVAGGDVNADGFADILVGPDTGGQPEVKVFNGKTGAALYDFYAYGPGITGGVRVALGDVTGDGQADIVTVNGPGSAPEVRVFSGATGALVQDYFVSSLTGSNLFIAAADVTGDLRADVIIGTGTGPTDVRVFDGVTSALIHDFTAYTAAVGVRVGAVAISSAGYADIVTVPASGSSSEVKVFDGMSLAAVDDFFAFTPSNQNGFYVGGGG